MASRVVLNQARVRTTSLTLARKSVRKTTAAVNRKAADNAPGGLYSTGTLKQSIKWSMRTVGMSVVGESGSDLTYAIFPERGTQPHVILPRNARNLRFFWRRRGVWFRGPRVDHSGQKAQNFLTDALSTVAPRYGYKVVIYG